MGCREDFNWHGKLLKLPGADRICIIYVRWPFTSRTVERYSGNWRSTTTASSVVEDGKSEREESIGNTEVEFMFV